MKQKIYFKVLALALLAALTAPPASLPAAESSRGGTYLPMGWDARGEGLGGAAAILIRDDRSAYWNPANLTFLMSPRLSFGYTKPVPHLSNGYSIFSIGTGLLDTRSDPDQDVKLRRFGAALTITHLGLELSGGSGWNEGTIGLSSAFAPNSYNSLGLTCRLMKSWTDLEDSDSWGIALDIGWTALLRRRFTFAVVGRNTLSRISYPGSNYSIDPTWNLAVAQEDLYERVSLEWDLVLKSSELNRMLVGAEITVLSDILYILGGVDMRYTEGTRTITHLGFSAEYRKWEISMAYTFDPEDAFGRKARISFGYEP